MYDFLLCGGRVIDGTGAPWFHSDVAIRADTIAAVGLGLEGEACTVLDVSGLVVAPGFIDTHSHSDVTLIVNPRAESAVCQGITTQVVGQCGFSAAPIQEHDIGAYRAEGANFGVFGWEGYELTWRDFAGYRQRLTEVQPSINILTFLGHGSLRRAAMGMSARPATAVGLDCMRRELARALEQGAAGLSTGLTYPPAMFADERELVALCQVVGASDRLFATHIRSYGAMMLQALEETTRVAREAGARVNIAHMYPAASQFWGEMAFRAVQLLENALAGGVDATFDATLWPQGAGPLIEMLPVWAQGGGWPRTEKLLAIPQIRQQIVSELAVGGIPEERGVEIDWEDAIVVLTGSRHNDQWVGRSVAGIAEQRGCRPVDAALDMLVEDGGRLWVDTTCKSQADLDYLHSHSLCVPITDVFTVAPYGALCRPLMPRCYGAFCHYLGDYVRDRQILTLEQAVHKLTKQAAHRIRLWDRGHILPGMKADITVFDPATVASMETYEHPHAWPVGIEYVFVNGRLTIDKGKHTGTQAGSVL